LVVFREETAKENIVCHARDLLVANHALQELHVVIEWVVLFRRLWEK
jgi:hypothetical protein